MAEDPQWAEQARQAGLILKKEKEGLFLIERRTDEPAQEAPPSGNEPAQSAQASDQRETAKQAATK